MLDSEAAERFRVTLDLADAGIELMRQNLRRRHPSATTSEIDSLLRAWLEDRPLDAPGQVRRAPL